MKNSKTLKTVLIATVIFVTGTTVAFAQGGWDRGGGWHGHHMMGPGYGPGYSNLTKEEAAKIDAERDRFYDETRTLRRDIDDKEYELRKAINSDDPDTGKISAIQKDLSKLQADFDQKRVQHRLAMRKILPDKAIGMGMGRGYGDGRGGRGGGYCWRQ